jgi:hypothetical protein
MGPPLYFSSPRHSLCGSKRRVRIVNLATSEGSTPVASISTANDPFSPQMPSFSQTQEYQPFPYSNHSSNYNTESSSFHLARRAPPAIHTSMLDSLQSVVPSSMNLNSYNLNFYGNLRWTWHIYYCRLTQCICSTNYSTNTYESYLLFVIVCRVECEIGWCDYPVTSRDIFVTARNVVCTNWW